VKTPSSNIQAPVKLQASSANPWVAHGFLKFGGWNFSGAWRLEFGA
jgi:hypothetical protein